VRAAAQAAAWRLPQRVAAAACSDADLGSIARRLPADVLAAALDEVGCLLIPDPDGPGRSASLERAAARGLLALGPAGPLEELSGSWSLARAALSASEAGLLSESGVLLAEENLGELLVFEGGAIARRIATVRLAPLEQLTEKARTRMLETARAYVRHQGNSVAMAAALHVHPQTVRYRTARLRELLGGQLDDPDARFELEVALRHLGRQGRRLPGRVRKTTSQSGEETP
jgi:hypothetical protein